MNQILSHGEDSEEIVNYLMEIAPDDGPPAYGGYFNALVAPAALLPLAGAALIEVAGMAAVFAASVGAALLHWLVIRQLRNGERARGAI